jgi:dTDP-4-amino-4,6-dideoxygalactose transaminase
MTTVTWDRHKGHAWSYDVVAAGYNYRIDEIRAAMGRVQLQKLAANNARRQKLDEQYLNMLQELAPDVKIPFKHYRGKASYHIRPILLPPGSNRQQFMDAMKKAGIQTSIHYPPIHQFTEYQRSARTVHLPVTTGVAASEVTLPLYPHLEPQDVSMVVQATRAALRLRQTD